MMALQRAGQRVRAWAQSGLDRRTGQPPSPSTDAQPFMGLEAEAPVGMGLYKGNRQLLTLKAIAAGLEQQQGARDWPPWAPAPADSGRAVAAAQAMAWANSRSAGLCTTTLSSSQRANSSAVGGRWAFGERVIQSKRPLEGVDAAGFEVQGQAGIRQGRAKGPQVMFEGLTAGDHHKAGPGGGGGPHPLHQLAERALGWAPPGQECLVSHQGQPTEQPARRMKKALRPARAPSPAGNGRFPPPAGWW
jgi:hypothetical protein